MTLRGETVYVDGKPIDDVLVHCGESALVASSIDDWQGAYADYTLYFPMSYQEDLTGRHITVRGIDTEVLGHPDHERPMSVFGRWHGRWDMTVRVRRVIAGAAQTLSVIAKMVERDGIGRRVEKVETLYSGAGQARMSSGAETDRSDGTMSSASYVFVIDWLDALRDYQTQQLFVEYDGRTFDVISVENKDERSETAILRGECRE